MPFWLLSFLIHVYIFPIEIHFHDFNGPSDNSKLYKQQIQTIWAKKRSYKEVVLKGTADITASSRTLETKIILNVLKIY